MTSESQDNSEIAKLISGRDLLNKLSREVVDLCSLVDFWLNKQSDLAARIAELETRLSELEIKYGEIAKKSI